MSVAQEGGRGQGQANQMNKIGKETVLAGIESWFSEAMKDKAEQHFRIMDHHSCQDEKPGLVLLALICEQKIGFQRLNTEPEIFEFDFWHLKKPPAECGQVI